MSDDPRLQIHQTNDPEILEFFNTHAIEFRLIGDHLFVIRGRDADLAAGPGDWLTIASDGAVEVTRGYDAARAGRLIGWARDVRRSRALLVRTGT
jgi:hypothetical protein